MLHILVVLSGLSVVAEVGAQVANNMPNEPGDKNFPPEAESGEAVELEKGLPVVNAKFKWPVSTLNTIGKLRGVQSSLAMKHRVRSAIDAVDADERELLDAARLAKSEIEALTALGDKKNFLQRSKAQRSVASTEQDNREKAASFLATKVGWVDPYEMKNSLYLSQLMRAPAQASVNVLVRENAHELAEHAKYKAMESAARYLKSSVDVGALKSKAAE